MFDFNRVETYIKILTVLKAETIVFGKYQIGIENHLFYLDEYDKKSEKFIPRVEEIDLENFKIKVAKYILNSQEEK